MVLNDGNRNDLLCKISSKVLCHYHENEIFITNKFFFYKFHYLISLLPMIMHWNKFYEENEMIKVG